MHEIDLIPLDYRESRLKRRWVRRWLAAVAFLVAVSGVAHMGLDRWRTAVKENLAGARQQHAAVLARRQRLVVLGKEMARLQKQVADLKALRAGVPVVELFASIDKAIDAHKVWFTRWRYEGDLKHSGKGTARTAASARVAAGTGPDAGGAKRARLDIAGKAIDHEALSVFVSRLVAQPGVEDARIVDARQVREAEGAVVSFRLMVKVRS